MAGAVDLGFGPLFDFLAGPLRTWSAPARHWVASWSVATQVVLYVVSTDFLGYWVHRWMHSTRLWRVRAFHHSPRTMNWLAGMRGSPIHMVLVIGPGAIMGAMLLLTESRSAFYVLMLIEMASQHFTHSNIRLPFARQLEWLLVTPRMHLVHHHRDPTFGNSNYGFYFAIWDHPFGTYTNALDVADQGHLGLREDYTMKSLVLGVRLDSAARAAES